MKADFAEGWAGHVDHVGSLIRPPRLMEAWRDCDDGRGSAEALRRVQDECVRDIVALQENAGLSLVTDGEFRRAAWSRGFVSAVDGMEFRPTELRFRDEQGHSFQAPAPLATKKLARLRPIVVDDYKFLKTAARKSVPKVTMPSPSHMHFGHFGACADRTIYPDLDRYWDDLVEIFRAEIRELAAAGCTYLQLDECPLALIFDEENVAVQRRLGEDPDELLDTYVRITNAALKNRPKTMMVAMHMCRGNAQGLWLGSAGYDRVADRVFNEIDVDAYLLEYDTPRAGDFSPLRLLPKNKRAFLGIVSTKDARVEAADTLVRRVEDAAKHTDVANLGLCPQCGFASAAMSKFNIRANPMNVDIQQHKLERIAGVAERVWG